mmetsp:Transcript_58076/g.124774  ORF Transcript_58076/g.124774 Transcript_58076/m.124774 type:complete len:241 (+) Transcript_58076:72-794(+)
MGKVALSLSFSSSLWRFSSSAIRSAIALSRSAAALAPSAIAFASRNVATSCSAFALSRCTCCSFSLCLIFSTSVACRALSTSSIFSFSQLRTCRCCSSSCCFSKLSCSATRRASASCNFSCSRTLSFFLQVSTNCSASLVLRRALSISWRRRRSMSTFFGPLASTPGRSARHFCRTSATLKPLRMRYPISSPSSSSAPRSLSPAPSSSSAVASTRSSPLASPLANTCASKFVPRPSRCLR